MNKRRSSDQRVLRRRRVPKMDSKTQIEETNEAKKVVSTGENPSKETKNPSKIATQGNSKPPVEQVKNSEGILDSTKSATKINKKNPFEANKVVPTGENFSKKTKNPRKTTQEKSKPAVEQEQCFESILDPATPDNSRKNPIEETNELEKVVLTEENPIKKIKNPRKATQKKSKPAVEQEKGSEGILNSAKPSKKMTGKTNKKTAEHKSTNSTKAQKFEEDAEAVSGTSLTQGNVVEQRSASSKQGDSNKKQTQRKRKVGPASLAPPIKKNSKETNAKGGAKLATQSVTSVNTTNKPKPASKSKPPKEPLKEDLSKPPNRSVLQLKIVLCGITPPIWRRIQVLNSDTFFDLSNHIKQAMGWNSCHLHHFIAPSPKKDHNTLIVLDDFSLPKERGTLDQKNTKLSRFLNQKGDTVLFEYDMGDSWMHEIRVEKILPPPPPKAEFPKCKGGKRACPPEDCGGVPGYNHLIEVYKNPKHEEYQELIVNWLGDQCPGWDPEKFVKNGIFRRVWMWLPSV